MQEENQKIHSQPSGQNVFIDFQIIKDSNPNLLYKELDVLIAAGKQIHVWSKTIPEPQMMTYCKSVIIKTSAEELALHKSIFDLRHSKRKTFSEIANILSIPVGKVSYFSKVNPSRVWTLNDWIKGYHKKDSSIYPKVDYLIDNDPKIVERFKRAGRVAHTIKKV